MTPSLLAAGEQRPQHKNAGALSIQNAVGKKIKNYIVFHFYNGLISNIG